jgi:hypothetical protein
MVVAHYDGKVLIPEGAVDLPIGPKIKFQVVEPAEPVDLEQRRKALQEFARHVESDRDATADLPPDFAAQYKHYLYGTPKQA